MAAKTRPDQALFGIVQGGVFRDLREQSAAFLLGLDLPGYAIGGLAVGESKAEMHAVLEWLHPVLPANKPRYLMGVGAPEDLVNGVLRDVYKRQGGSARRSAWASGSSRRASSPAR